MGAFFLSIRGFFTLGAILATALLGGGCGGSSSQVDVQTGALTKAEFIERANAVCKAVRSNFTQDFANYYRDHPLNKAPSEEEWLEGIIETAVQPNYEIKMVKEIGAIGVPGEEKEEVVAFLEALRQRIDELKEKPAELNKTPYPFAKPAALAKKYGLDGCAGAFS